MENYQIKTGFVVGIEDDRISIQLLPTLSGECGTSCRCKALAMIENSKGPKIWVKGNYKDRFHLNDFVTVEADLPSPYVGIFFLFILPVLGLFLGAFLGHFLAVKYSSWNQQILSIIGAATGFFLAIGIAIFSDNLMRRKKEIFKIKEISEQDMHKECKKAQKAVSL